jgi:hypothetical protein
LAGVRQGEATLAAVVVGPGALDQAARDQPADHVRHRRRRLVEAHGDVGGVDHPHVDRVQDGEVLDRQPRLRLEPLVEQPIGVAGGLEDQAEELEEV